MRTSSRDIETWKGYNNIINFLLDDESLCLIEVGT